MKKLLSLGLVLILCFALFACGGESDTTTTTTTENTTSITVKAENSTTEAVTEENTTTTTEQETTVTTAEVTTKAATTATTTAKPTTTKTTTPASTTTTTVSVSTTEELSATNGRKDLEELVDDFITAMCTGDAKLGITLMHPKIIEAICRDEKITYEEFLTYMEEYGTGTEEIAEIVAYDYEILAIRQSLWSPDKLEDDMRDDGVYINISQTQDVNVKIEITTVSEKKRTINYKIETFKSGDYWYLKDIDG